MTITTIPRSSGYPGLCRITVGDRTFIATGCPDTAQGILMEHIRKLTDVQA